METTTNPNWFHGSKVRLAAAIQQDAQTLAAYTEDYDYMRNLDTDYAVPQTVAESGPKSAKMENGVEFMLRTIDEDRLIGFVALHSIEWNNQAAKLAIGIGKAKDRGKGYGSDALQIILRYAFHELNLNRVGLEVISYNEVAYHAYKKAGFIEEGRKRAAVLRGGKAYDLILMSMLRDEWESKIQA
ncbi:GNAT family N-acetyltransferase [Paenibacillus gallinarum]|uniref:GNAT family N-acetyltransferase n=1 Tax=Paenibacillus gallinarum TaxID=2762232 RepID=A0ABR8SU28_9BACL|nr:GNAT family protein [Paenibacillus gallinarum]MBD7966629.1 GNAT family N-acetyltransferase [Paenibacillus gallinarum]